VRELDEELGIRVRGGERTLEYCYAYPDRRVHLDVWSVARFAGVPEPRESQRLAWVRPDQLTALELLAADWPIVEVLAGSPAVAVSTGRA
jgi:8-oxo-dGTP pyrophosphatase MutT (NUDIX family)